MAGIATINPPHVVMAFTLKKGNAINRFCGHWTVATLHEDIHNFEASKRSTFEACGLRT